MLACFELNSRPYTPDRHLMQVPRDIRYSKHATRAGRIFSVGRFTSIGTA